MAKQDLKSAVYSFLKMISILNTAPEVRIRTLYWQLQVPSSRLGVFQEQKGAKVFTDTRVNKE